MLNFNATTNNYHHLSENVIFILSSFRLICFPSLLFFIFFYYYCFIYFFIFYYYFFCFLCRSLRKRVQKKLNFNATSNKYHHLSENVIFILSSFRLIRFPSFRKAVLQSTLLSSSDQSLPNKPHSH